MRNPTHFEIISSRRFFDHDKAADVSRDNAELIELTERTLAEAFAAGQLRSADLKQVQIAGRALVYGFARMNIDGHFPRWGVAGAEAERTAEAILDLFIEGSPSLMPSFRASEALNPAMLEIPSSSFGFAQSRTPPPNRQIHCVFMTIPLRFYDTTQVPAASCVSWSSPAKTFALRRVMLRRTRWRPRQIQVRPLPPLPPALPRSVSGGFRPLLHRTWRRWRSCCRPKPISVRASVSCCHGAS